MQFPDNPAVRAQAMEAGELLGPEAAPLIREAVKDEHPGVRFAACMALGRVRDAGANEALAKLAEDHDENVRVAAYFALERLGDSRFRTAWGSALRRSQDPAVRRNAVLALGQLEDPAVRPLLQAAMSDEDEAVRIQAWEALAALGDRPAVTRFIHDAYGAAGYKQLFAVSALGRAKDERVVPALRARMANSPYPEARVAAAGALGKLGYPEGYDVALQALTWNASTPDLPDDPPENQVMRVRSLAALALGDIGDPRALPSLRQRMETRDDPRVQLSAARGILMILGRITSAPAT